MDETAPREALEDLGLSAYAAETLIALQKLGPATARDIAAVTDVPRSQVYGATEELEEAGLVNTQDGSPKEFAAVEPSAVEEILQARMDRKTDTAVEYLEAVRSTTAAHTTPDAEHVWQRQGLASITQQAVELIEDATTEIQYYVGAPAYLPSDIADALAKRAEDGVAVQLYTASDAAFTDAAFDVDPATVSRASLAASSLIANRCTRVVLVDEHAVLLGVATGSQPRDELCFWTHSDQIAPLFAAAFTAYFERVTDAA